MYRSLLILGLVITFLSSCSKSESECDSDIKVASFELNEKSMDWFIYDEVNSFVFQDQGGSDHFFLKTSQEYKTHARGHVKTLCGNLLFGHHEYFSYNSKKVEYRNPVTNDYITIEIGMSSTSEEDIEAKTIYDEFIISGKIEELGGYFKTYVITGYQQNGPFSENSSRIKYQAQLIDDPEVAEDIYYDTHLFDIKTYFTKEDGLIKIEDRIGNYFRLK